jgi:Carbohydrate binding module (family 6)
VTSIGVPGETALNRASAPSCGRTQPCEIRAPVLPICALSPSGPWMPMTASPEPAQLAIGLVEVVLDSPDNTPVGSFSVANTGGWSTWETIPANITTVTGTHNVYLEFVSGAGGDPAFVSLHYYDFPVSLLRFRLVASLVGSVP